MFDNTAMLNGWCNDLSSYANWLAKYAGAKDILDMVYDCRNDDDYENLLACLADKVLDERELKNTSTLPTVGSIYECEGDYRFEEYEDEEDEWDDECEYEKEEIW